MLVQMLAMSTFFNWHNQWYPIAIEKFVDKSKPFKSVVLDKAIVTWYDGKYWNTVNDRCPHRGAPLSEGRLEHGMLQCPYHGYEFNGCGECVKIPQTLRNDRNFLSKMDTNSKITTVNDDVIWVWMNSTSFPTYDPPKYVNSEEDSSIYTYIKEDYMTSVPFDYRYLQENIMDVSHTSFTHHGTQSDRKFATPIEYKITSKPNINGFSMISKNYPEEEYSRYNHFIAPSYHVTSIKRRILGCSFNNTLVTYALPIESGKSQVISRFMIEGDNNIFLRMLFSIVNIVPIWLRHLMVHEFVEDDIIMINRMQEYNSRMNIYKILTDTDTPIILWNKWLKEFTDYPTLLKQKVNIYKTNKELIERYDRHTKHCNVCMDTKRRMKYYRGVLCMCVLYAIVNHDLYLSTVLFSIIIVTNNIIKRFDVGKYPPKRNQ